MKKKHPPISAHDLQAVSTTDLLACVVSLQPGTQTFFHEERDGHWLEVNKNLPGLKRPKPRPRPAVLTADYFSREQMIELINRAIGRRDFMWKLWASDVLAQSLEPEGPKPIHLHFTEGE